MLQSPDHPLLSLISHYAHLLACSNAVDPSVLNKSVDVHTRRVHRDHYACCGFLKAAEAGRRA